MAKKQSGAKSAIDRDCAESSIAAFSGACGIECRLLSPEGDALYLAGRDDGCAQCRRLLSDRFSCTGVHLYGAHQSERFGGRYIYFCPCGFAWCAAPIMAGGQLAGALACGPTLIMDPEDFLSAPPWFSLHLSPEEETSILTALQGISRKTPAVFGDISATLLALAVYVGDHSRTLLDAQQSTAQQQSIGETMQELNALDAPPSYPLAKERELVQAIEEGDQPTARRLMNELLGHILFYTGGDFSLIRARSLELMSVLSRAAADGGAELSEVLSLNHQFLRESDHLHTPEELTLWLTHVMERYTSLVFDMVDIKHRDLLYKAIHYMKEHYDQHITLDETARYIGFSPTYFSKVFKEELGCTFNFYLSRLRIDKSKALLLSDGISIGEVCARSGFEDQSYFIKVFRKHLGVTPGQFRQRQGHLDPSKERTSSI